MRIRQTKKITKSSSQTFYDCHFDISLVLVVVLQYVFSESAARMLKLIKGKITQVIIQLSSLKLKSESISVSKTLV